MNSKLFTYIKHISNAGLLLLVFFLSWQTRLILKHDPIGYLEVSLYGIDLLLIFCVIFSVIPNLFRNLEMLKRVQHDKERYSMIITVVFFLLWNIVSVTWASDKILAVQHVAWILLAAGLAWLVATYENKARLIFWFVMGLMINAWLGIWQFVSQSTFANKWLGLAVHDRMLGGTSIIEMYASDGSPIRWLRAYGSFDHPNIFGAMMMIGIIIALWLLTNRLTDENHKSHGWQNVAIATKCNIFINEKKLILYLALASMSAGLFVSLSRNAWLGLALGIIVLLLPSLRSKLHTELRNKFQKLSKAVLIVVTIVVVTAAIYPAQFLMRSGGSGRLETKSIDDRAAYFQQGKDLISSRPLLGTGIGNYIESLKIKYPDNPAWTYQPVHNVPVLVWAELGIVGMLVGVALFAALWLYTWRAKNGMGMALLASLIPAMLFDHWLWDLHFGILFFGLTVGIIMHRPERI